MYKIKIKNEETGDEKEFEGKYGTLVTNEGYARFFTGNGYDELLHYATMHILLQKLMEQFSKEYKVPFSHVRHVIEESQNIIGDEINTPCSTGAAGFFSGSV